MENEKKKSFLPAVFLELSIIVALVIGILLSLNYFNVLPLSSTFSFFAFLPKASVVSSPSKVLQIDQKNVNEPNLSQNPNGSGTVKRSIISVEAPRKLINNESAYKYFNFPTAAINVKSPLTIDLDVSAIGGEEGQDSGIIFNNRLQYADAGYAHIRLFYDFDDTKWILEHKANNKSQYISLNTSSSDRDSIKASIFIGQEGKLLKITIAGQKDQNITLQEPLYKTTNSMGIIAKVAPNSELEVSSLSYR